MEIEFEIEQTERNIIEVLLLKRVCVCLMHNIHNKSNNRKRIIYQGNKKP